MSIQTELTRITNAKTAIKTAIEGKGVTVPDGTMLDGMAALIEAIEAGGSVILGYNIISGTYTPTENIISTVEVYTSGFVASSSTAVDNVIERSIYFTFVMKPNSDYIIQYPTSFFNAQVFSKTVAYNVKSSSSGSTSVISVVCQRVSMSSPNGYGIKVYIPCSSKYPLVSGQTYAWMMFVPDDISL